MVLSQLFLSFAGLCQKKISVNISKKIILPLIAIIDEIVVLHTEI